MIRVNLNRSRVSTGGEEAASAIILDSASGGGADVKGLAVKRPFLFSPGRWDFGSMKNKTSTS